MAFANKISSLFKKAVTSNPSLHQAVRCMSSSKLFVGGVSYGTDDTGLREAFSQHGEVVEARVIMDRETGRSRGFGFVTYTSSEEASAAIAALDGKDLHGRIVSVNYATERTGGFGGGGYGGGGGGYGGGGGGYGGGAAAMAAVAAAMVAVVAAAMVSVVAMAATMGVLDSYGNTGNTGYGGNYGGGDSFGRSTSNYPTGTGGGNYTAGGGDGFSSSDQHGSNLDSNLDGRSSGGYGGSQDGPLDDFKEDDDFAKRA